MHKLKDLPGPKAAQIIEILKNLCYDSTFAYPLVIANGHGCILTDVDGNRFLDFTSNIGACPLGYSHPEIISILKEYSNNGAHKIAGQDFYCQEHAQLAEKLLGIVPGNFKSFFINSGAEAVENAIKIAFKKMGPLPGISCINAFHGRTLGALSYTFSKPVQKYNIPELPVKRIKFCTSDNDPDIEQIDNLIPDNKVAFIICEIIQGEGGYNFASKKFIKKLRKASEEYKVPLIIDEVQSGIGRTGKWWAYEHYEIVPDMITAAKALQIGATIYDKKYDPNQRGALSSTWGGGSRIDLAVGAKIIETIEKKSLMANATKMGLILKKAISEKIAKSCVKDVRGLGLMIAIEFDSKLKRDNKIIELFRHGLLVLPAGQKSVRIIPPLIISEEEINRGLEIMEDVL